MKKSLFYIILTAALYGFAGCSMEKQHWPDEGADLSNGTSTPRLVIRGTVSNGQGEALAGIYVSATNVREVNEPDLLSYNYAVTDSAGQYTIIRYRGRELPAEVTVVATDSTGVYQEAYLFAPVTYDTITTRNGKVPYNGFVTADFVLQAK